jgi:hypothetical protein
MKKTILIAGILIAGSCKLLAQTSTEISTVTDKKFIAAMEASLKILDTATSPETFMMLANNFERIAKAEQKQWQPFYYTAYCYAVMAAYSPDKSKIDPLTEKAESYLTLAEALNKNNSEISTLRGMILYTRITVDPISRWQSMGTEAMALLEKAKQQNPANPRPYLVDANAKLRIPVGLGGGTLASKTAVEECLGKFKVFVPENSIAPRWGKPSAEKLLQTINAQ